MNQLRIYGILAFALLPRLLFADNAKLIPALGWDRETQGSFVVSVTVDAQNNVWAGTEGNGVWRYDSRKKEWTQFTARDGLGDDCVYALAADKLGRVWAGHLNHGVSVWNGEKWKNYDILDGPLGSRVFAIATCPADGDVWIATDCGVARYSLAKDDWDYYTRASGLPSNQIQAIAFDSKGDIFLGTQCDGIATASAADDYRKWKTVPGPLQPPNAVTGDGLPGSLINDIAVIHPSGQNTADQVFAATPDGMGERTGEKWIFYRGEDWQQNENGLYDPPAAVPAPGQPPAQDKFWMEDWITCVRQDAKSGDIWIGYRKKGVEIIPATQGAATIAAEWGNVNTPFVHAICLPPKGPPLIAVANAYNGGLMTVDSSTAGLEPGAAPPQTAPPLPSAAKPADAASLAALAARLDLFKDQLKPGEGVFLGDDWRTEGDWIGRYGKGYAMLCGMDSNVYQGDEGYAVNVGLGPHVENQTEIQSHNENENTNSLRMLYNPGLGHRVEAELHDPGYPETWEGPDIWIDATIPAGIHCVSLYFTNNDEQVGNDDNRFRDYDVQLLAWDKDADVVQKSAPLARARVTDFHGGVYKRFIVGGPARYVFRIGRDHSFFTKVQGIFIDRLSAGGPDEHKPLPGFDAIQYAPAAPGDKSVIDASPVLAAANSLWDALGKSFDKRAVAGLQIPLRIAAYRAASAANAPSGLLEGWRWQAGIWTEEDRDAFDKAVAEAFKASQKNGN